MISPLSAFIPVQTLRTLCTKISASQCQIKIFSKLQKNEIASERFSDVVHPVIKVLVI